MILFQGILLVQAISAQEVEVQGTLKVSDMSADDTIDDLVIRKTDGTLGTRDVATLPPPPPPIDDSRNFASDFELAKYLCDCPNPPPPFFIKSLLDNGYSEAELFEAGIPYANIQNAQFTCGESFTDMRDNQSYSTVFIAGQCWMAENLNVGTMIYGTQDQIDNYGFIEKYCYADNASNCDTYGGLYQWDEMMQYSTVESTQGICPAGWHLPSDGEIKMLEMALGMSQEDADLLNTTRGLNQGSKMADNAVLWTDGALENDPEFGTSALDILPGGFRVPGGFIEQSNMALLWSSSESTYPDAPLNRLLLYNETGVGRDYSDKVYGYSVRCLKD
jgi:uncharacterized protein (TIGR02145 family)